MTCTNSVNWKVRRGTALIKTLMIKQNGLPLDLTGQDINCIITDYSGRELINVTSSLEIERTSGKIVVKISAPETLKLPITSNLIYVDIASEPDYPINFLKGNLTVTEGGGHD